MEKRNVFLYVVRGNHDNPMFFDGTHNFSNLIFMEDYDVIQVDDLRILGVGGAISVDRKPNRYVLDMNGRSHKGRRENIDWWPSEVFKYDEKKASSLVGIDVVATHTAPLLVPPLTLGGETVQKFMLCDSALKVELTKERELMGELFTKLQEKNNIQAWYYGHFHDSNSLDIDGTKFQMLDINELLEFRV